eukprot:6034519-Lingulodinium_polyedra.AAC.1
MAQNATRNSKPTSQTAFNETGFARPRIKELLETRARGSPTKTTKWKIRKTRCATLLRFQFAPLGARIA